MAGDAVAWMTPRGAGHASSAAIRGPPGLAGHGLMNGSGSAKALAGVLARGL